MAERILMTNGKLKVTDNPISLKEMVLDVIFGRMLKQFLIKR